MPAIAPPLKPSFVAEGIALEDVAAFVSEGVPVAIVVLDVEEDVVAAATDVDVVIVAPIVVVVSLLPEKAEPTEEMAPIPVVSTSEGMAVLSCLATTRF